MDNNGFFADFLMTDQINRQGPEESPWMLGFYIFFKLIDAIGALFEAFSGRRIAQLLDQLQMDVTEIKTHHYEELKSYVKYLHDIKYFSHRQLYSIRV